LTEPGNPTLETKKRVRSVLGLWKALENLEREYPKSMIMLMDGSAPFDILVIDPKSGWLRAVEVKSAAASSSGSRSLSPNQKKLKSMFASTMEWKATFDKYVMYGEPGTGLTMRKVEEASIS
jgi:hypothetical protein